MRFGIMGPGGIARVFCRAAKVVEGAEVVAVSSKSLERAKSFAEQEGVPSYYDSYEEMVKREDIDVVYIATTHNFHFENIMLALSHGKHVLCEKCMVLTKADAETVFKTAKEKGLFVMEATWSRFIPAMRQAKEWVDEGKIGELINTEYALGFVSKPGSRLQLPELAGGAMYDVGIYGFETVTYFSKSPIVDIKSHITWKDGVDVIDSVILCYEDGSTAAFNCTISAPMNNHLYLYGTKGRILMDNPLCPNSCTLEGLDKSTLTYSFPVEHGMQYEIKEVISCIEQGKLESDIVPHSTTVACAEMFDRTLRGE